MKPPNNTTPSTEQPQITSQQPSPAASIDLTANPVTNPVSSQPIITKPQTIVATTAQIQQAPLALTTQPQNQIRPQIQTTPQNLQPQSTTTTAQATTQPQPLLIQQTKMQTTQLPTKTTTPSTVQPIALATAPSTTGPTALVIIPQHSTNSSANPTKLATKVTPITTTVNVTTAHVTLAAASQSTPIQLQAPITTHVPNITTPIPLTPAHQQAATIVQPTLANRPPTSLPIVPITTSSANIKSEPNKYICCLLDNGIRCDRIAGNASFSARIQKIVQTKKMTFALDPTVRHAYICEHHKAIITVAKKSTPVARDTKSNARNYTANNNANNPTTQPISNYNDLTRQQPLQHPVNIELLTNQNRLANNHGGPINSLPVRPGAQITYTHYPGTLTNQVAPMDVMMSSSFENTSRGNAESAPSGSGGVDVDLQQLQVNTLRRYKRHFRVQTRPGLNKMQLAESLKSHFRTLPIIEKEAITYFVYIVKCYRNKLDHNPKAD